MKNLNTLNIHRDVSSSVIQYFGSVGDHETGVFNVRAAHGGYYLRVIATSGKGWDHVSVSHPHRCPTWEEMEQVKRMFFKETECAFQLHPPVAEYINHHPYCLHLWRCHTQEPPRPPSIMVGPSPISTPTEYECVVCGTPWPDGFTDCPRTPCNGYRWKPQSRGSKPY